MLDEFRREMAMGARSASGRVELSVVENTFDTVRSRRIAIINLIRLSYVDGEFDVEEECYLKQVAHRFGIEDAEFRRMDSWVRRLVTLEREALDLFLQS